MATITAPAPADLAARYYAQRLAFRTSTDLSTGWAAQDESERVMDEADTLGLFDLVDWIALDDKALAVAQAMATGIPAHNIAGDPLTTCTACGVVHYDSHRNSRCSDHQ